MAPSTGQRRTAAARQKRQEEVERRRRLEEKRAAEVARLQERLAFLLSHEPRTTQLKSVLSGLYDEMDKLSKKAPTDQITELALKRINDVITRCKALLKGDEFIDSIDPFVAAGERPEHRDALLILRELREGITRLEAERRALSGRASTEEWAGFDDGADADEDD